MHTLDIVKRQGIGIAASVHHRAVRARHKPAEVPTATPVAHRDVGLNPDHGMRPADEKLLVGVVVSGADLDEDLVFRAA